ncbi:MAG: ribose-phosphate pyrophosphokinase [Rhizobiales bacterium]|nr:ribose-phosphate pyrophosphokinase [Hyphomicrobiales bacterium]MBO6700373.1 ribose-phosphate pyrophosphokinase [Hyphomicrobiales bacterium]MBO6737463.1 ribose-phosphate pyrophosphokinase [Hyphomicrobiales bacterium]MBO6913480.1 ribose-phosphate pyrophosphokinase [Hyphomicrobiales bacterium]MBO6955411.1 ribose-phosphate pyrophosphokinase [Hyphomicrobiales bacterium]
MPNPDDLVFFALNGSDHLGDAICARLGQLRAPHEERDFGDGEHKARPLQQIGGCDVYVLHSLHGQPGTSTNDKLVRLLFFIATLKDAGAKNVTAICPYLAYSRKDRRTKPHDPVSSRYVAQLFESVGLDRIVTVDVHNVSAFENAFRGCRTIHAVTAPLLADHIEKRSDQTSFTVMAPDAGGAKRAEVVRQALQQRFQHPVTKAIIDKHRSEGAISGSLFAGDVAGRTVVIVDDIVSSGGTMLRAIKACREAGAARILASATHGLFTAQSSLIGSEGPDELIVSDTVPLPAKLQDNPNLTVLSVAGLLADIVARLHEGGDVGALLAYS